MTTKNMYMLRDFDDITGHTHAAEAIYEVDDATAERWIQEGAAVATDFHTLDNTTSEVTRFTNEYIALVDRIEGSTALDDLQKKIRVMDAREALEQRIESLKASHETEIKAQKMIAADNVFQVAKVSDESREYVDSVITHMQSGIDPETVVMLITSALPTFTPEKKTAILQRMPEIKTLAADKAKLFDQLTGALYDKSAQLKYKQLQAYEKRDPLAYFRNTKISHHTFSPTFLSHDEKVKIQAERDLKSIDFVIAKGGD